MTLQVCATALFESQIAMPILTMLPCAMLCVTVHSSDSCVGCAAGAEPSRAPPAAACSRRQMVSVFRATCYRVPNTLARAGLADAGA